MTKRDLIEFANKNEIQPRYYSLNGEFVGDDAFYLAYSKGKWLVYYFERGRRYDIKKYKDEEDAITDIYNRMKVVIDAGGTFPKYT